MKLSITLLILAMPYYIHASHNHDLPPPSYHSSPSTCPNHAHTIMPIDHNIEPSSISSSWTVTGSNQSPNALPPYQSPRLTESEYEVILWEHASMQQIISRQNARIAALERMVPEQALKIHQLSAQIVALHAKISLRGLK